MTFLNPTYLWTLLGVLVPIAIHLWSRRKVMTVKVGSTKLLQESEPKRTSTIRPNELWLLVLRILTIILIALILAMPQLRKTTENTAVIYLVEPTLLDNTMIEGLLDGIPEESIRTLSKGFPASQDYDGIQNSEPVPNYWQLAQEINDLPADSIVVFVNGFSSGIKGKRPESSDYVNWMALNSDDSYNQIIEVKKKGDSLELLTLFSDSEKLQFEKRKLPQNSSAFDYNAREDTIVFDNRQIALTTEESLHILIVHTGSMVQEQKYLTAAFRAISKFLERPIEIEARTKKDLVKIEPYDLSIWLGVAPLKHSGGTRLVFKPDALVDQLISPGNHRNEFFLTASLNSENTVSEHLSEKLIELLKLREDLEKKIRPNDKRVLSSEELRPVTTDKTLKGKKASLFDVSPWLWILLVILMIAERTLAKFRKQ